MALASGTRLGPYDVVEDESSPEDYRVEVGPFPGWEDVPSW